MGYVNHGRDTYGTENCALCTIAAIFNTNTIQISKLLGLNGHQPAGAFAIAHRKKHMITEDPGPGEELQQDFNGMKEFVVALRAHLKKPVHTAQGGSYDTPVPLSTQISLMNSYPVGTQFAIWGCQEFKGMGAHWNYAIRNNNGVEFRDYQYNTSDASPPVTSFKFIPPKGHETEADDYKMGIVLVFKGVELKMPYE